MKLLITGSTGFVGRHLVPKLIDLGHEILEVTRNPLVCEDLYGNKTKKYKITYNQENFIQSVRNFNPEVAIHLASYLTANDDYLSLQTLLQTNIEFYCRVLDALKNSNLKLFINTGTFAEYFKGDGVLDPAYLYSATKTASRAFLDYYSKVYDFKQTTVIPYTIYGGSDSQKKIIDIIYDSVMSQTPIDLSPGEQVLDFIHIDDVVDFYLHILENVNQLPHRSNFQLGTGHGHTLRQVAEIIEKVTEQETHINWGGKAYRPADVMYAVADMNYKLILPNWQPSIDLEKGIGLFINNRKFL